MSLADLTDRSLIVYQVHLRLAEADEKPADLSSMVVAAVPEWGHPLVDSCALAIFAVDAQCVVTYWNPAADSLIGWARGEVMGHPLPFDPHGPIQGKNGNFLDAAVWTAAIRSANGQQRGTMAIIAGSAALQEAGAALSSKVKPRMTVQI